MCEKTYDGLWFISSSELIFVVYENTENYLIGRH